MRLAAQAKAGYFPLHPDAVDAIASCLEAAPGAAPYVIDPCAGAGAAIHRLAGRVGAPADRIYGIELDSGRADESRQLMPKATILGPCSCLSADVSGGSFGLLYCNAPFDQELGGGRREEAAFFARCIHWLCPGGVCVFVLPERTLALGRELREAMTGWLEEDLHAFDVPAACRPYGECVVIGRRRRRPIVHWEARARPLMELRTWRDDLELPELGTTCDRWAVPEGARPAVFRKAAPTDAELAAALARSPLAARLLGPPPMPAPAAPPLALGDGHRALLLASGYLDGLVRAPGVEPHVVRGTARKVAEVTERTENTNDDGSVTVTEKKNERPVIVCRTLTADGTIRTLEQ